MYLGEHGYVLCTGAQVALRIDYRAFHLQIPGLKMVQIESNSTSSDGFRMWKGVNGLGLNSGKQMTPALKQYKQKANLVKDLGLICNNVGILYRNPWS